MFLKKVRKVCWCTHQFCVVISQVIFYLFLLQIFVTFHLIQFWRGQEILVQNSILHILNLLFEFCRWNQISFTSYPSFLFPFHPRCYDYMCGNISPIISINASTHFGALQDLTSTRVAFFFVPVFASLCNGLSDQLYSWGLL